MRFNHDPVSAINSRTVEMTSERHTDPVKKVTGALFTQILPFFDARVVSLYGKFERGLYRGLERT
jgi:hypothetical protein